MKAAKKVRKLYVIIDASTLPGEPLALNPCLAGAFAGSTISISVLRVVFTGKFMCSVLAGLQQLSIC